MKDLAKHYARARMTGKQKKKKQEADDRRVKPGNQFVYGEVPDAWDPQYRPDVEDTARQLKKRRLERLREKRAVTKEVEENVPLEPEEEEEPEAEETFYVEEQRTRRRMKRNKRRTVAMSLAVSEEEEELLRAYAAKVNMSFSAWARSCLFRAMGRKVPARPKS